MRLHDLAPTAGSHRPRKRIGRGNASGQGTTAGKGTKGQRARSGGTKAGFRGMSSRNDRLAKRRGFNNIFKKQYEIVNIDRLNLFESGATVDIGSLKLAGLVSKGGLLVKLLGDGALETGISLHVVGIKVSKSARQKIVAAGGTVVNGNGVSVTSESEIDGHEEPASEEESSDSSGS
jgi:large subunit ribosomal protein L15